MNVLAVGAHPDDIEFFCGGTLILYAKQGHKVFMCHLLNGDLGHEEIPSDELREIRRQEAIESAKIIGAQSLTTDVGDLKAYDTDEMRIKTAEIIRIANPDIIITHSPNDYHSDHNSTSEIVFGASFASTLPQLKTENPRNDKITPIYYMDTAAGINFSPEEYVDITEVIETKKAMLFCHNSQIKWLKNHHKIDMEEFLYTTARFRGIQCDKKYAEGFKKFNAWGRNITKRVLP